MRQTHPTPLPGNGVLGVDKKASLWNIVGEDWFLPRVHLCSLQLLVSDETGKANTLTQGSNVMRTYQVPEEAIVPRHQGNSEDSLVLLRT